MPSVTLTRIDKRADGSVYLYFGKDVREYSSVEALRLSARSALGRADLIDLAIALALFRQPALGNPAALEGRTVAVDFSQAAWGAVT
jgi:hypothetical protein